MPRKPRFHVPHAFYHVILRGNNCQSIFFEQEDYLRFYLILQQGIERFKYQVHAFCLMNNHLHLLLQVGVNPISSGMQHLACRYSRYINKKQKRIGHLFQGRFKSIIVHDESYLKELIRYIHLNPVTAGITKAPEEYRWSSYKYYFNQGELPWLNTQWILSRFSTNLDQAKILFRNFVLQTPIESQALSRTFSQKSELVTYIESVERTLKDSRKTIELVPKYSLFDIINLVCDQLRIHPPSIQQKNKRRIEASARSMITLLIRKAPHLTLQEFAQWAQRDAGNLSKGATKMESDLEHQTNLRQNIAAIETALNNISKDLSSETKHC